MMPSRSRRALTNAVSRGPADKFRIGDDFLLLGDQLVVGGDGSRLDFLLRHMGRLSV